MRQTRNIHGLVHRRRNGIALAGDQRRRNRSPVAGQRGADALVDCFAHAIDEHGIMQRKRRRVRRFHGANAPEHEAGSADPRKIHVPSEVIAAGAQRFERRRKPCLELHELSDCRCRAFAQRHPNPFGLFNEAGAVHALDAQRDPVGAFALLPHLNEFPRCPHSRPGPKGPDAQ